MRREKGFSLIEVLLVVALVAVLSQVALPRYEAHVQRVHRTQVQQQLLALSQRLAQQHSLTGSFARSANAMQDNIDDAWLLEQGLDRWPAHASDPARRYRIRFVDGAPQAQAHTLMAEPLGAQQGDSCGVLMLDQRQIRGAGGVLDSRAKLSLRCWSR